MRVVVVVVVVVVVGRMLRVGRVAVWRSDGGLERR